MASKPLTVGILEGLEFAVDGRKRYGVPDGTVAGLSVRISAGTKAFRLAYRVKGGFLLRSGQCPWASTRH